MLLAALDESFFHYEPAKAGFNRILNLVKKRAQIISYDELVEDPSLNEEYRDILREHTKKPVTDLSRAKNLLATLDKYRKARMMYYMAKNILDDLKSPEIDVDKMLDGVTNRLTSIRSHDNEVDPVLTVGKDGNAYSLLHEALSLETDMLLKTGFKEFDEKNGGLPDEGVMLLAATTSGGKSVTRMNLMKNMYHINKVDVATVSLEMNAKKETRRLLSSLTGIPFWKFVKQKLSDRERALCKAAWKRFHRFGKANDCRYALMCPTRGLSIQQLLILLKPFGFKVIAIDYISLLAGVSDDNQWRILSDIARECKIFSSENHCLIVLLAQLDSDDDRIRYSKGVLEHADAAWVWNYSKPEQREQKILPVRIMKARDQELFNFDLRENFAMMQVLNMDDEVPDCESSTPSSGSSSSATEDDILGDGEVSFDDAAGVS